MWLANAVALALALPLIIARVSQSAFHFQPLEQLFSEHHVVRNEIVVFSRLT